MKNEILKTQSQAIMKGPAIDFMFAYQEQDLEKMLSFCDVEGEVWFKPMGEDGRGEIGKLGKAIWASLLECFPDISNTVHAAVKEEESIRCQVLIEGTQAKDFAGIKSNGLRFGSDHVFIFQLNEKQKIKSIQVEWDNADFSRQLTP